MGRYAQAWRSAWATRSEWDSQRRTRDELQFLPENLQLVETPTSPLARWVMWTLIAMFTAAVLWASFGKLDMVAVAHGKTVVDTQSKVLQVAETSIVRKILVRNGDRVVAGQPLVELDANASTAANGQAGSALIDARLTVLRLTALNKALEKGVLPGVDYPPDVPRDRTRTELELAKGQLGAYQARVLTLEANVQQRAAELLAAKNAVQPLSQSVSIAESRLADYASLVEGHYVGRHDYLARQQELISLKGQLTAARDRLVEVEASAKSARSELSAWKSDTLKQQLTELSEARSRVSQLEPEAARTAHQNDLKVLRAPADGIVQQVAIHTVGGVIMPAEALMVIVPSNERMAVEAMLPNQDIGFVRAGQHATVKIEAFPYTRYGYLDGTVETVSGDAANVDKGNPVYPLRVKLDRRAFKIDGREVPLSAGMALSVEIKTGRRRVISYFLGPLIEHGSEGLRER